MHIVADGLAINPSRHVRWGREEWLVSMVMWDKLMVLGMVMSLVGMKVGEMVSWS